MSAKPRKGARSAGKKAEKTAAPAKPRTVAPSGHVPQAVVSSRHSGGMVERRGRGFSEGELAGAGIPVRLARRFGAQIDSRRRSVLDVNVAAMKKWYAPPPRAPATVAKPKPTEKPAAKKRTRKKAEA